jgi:hypothetical protein
MCGDDSTRLTIPLVVQNVVQTIMNTNNLKVKKWQQ